jgi:hypothetical protein
VQEEPLRLPQASGQAPIEAFGGGAGVQGVLRTAEQEAQEQADRALDAQFREYDTRLAEEEARLRVAMEQQRGKNAIGAGLKATSEYEKFYRSISAGVSSPKVRDALARARARGLTNLTGAGLVHEARESERYEDETSESRIVSARGLASAYHDSDVQIEDSLLTQALEIDKYGKRKGLGEDWITAHIDEAISKTHRAVVTAYLENGDERGGIAYAGKVKERIVGPDRAMVDSMIRKAIVRVTSREVAERVRGLPPDAMKKELDAVEAEDSEVGKMAKDRAYGALREERAVEQQIQADIIEKWSSYFDKNRQAAKGIGAAALMDFVSPGDWEKLSPAQRSALERYARGPRLDGDPVKFGHFQGRLAAAPSEIAALSLAELHSQYLSYMNSDEQDQVKRAWAATVEAARYGGKNREDFKDLDSDNKRIMSAFLKTGEAGVTEGMSPKKMSDAQNKAYGTFHKEVNEARRSFQKATSRNPNDEQLDQLIARVVYERTRSVTVPFGELGFGTRLLRWGPYAFTGFGRRGPQEKLLKDVTPEDAPEEYAEAVKTLSRQGNPSDERALRLMKAMLADDTELARRIREER